MSTFRKAIGVQEAYKAGLAAGRKGGSGVFALKSSGSPSKILELLVACRSRRRAELEARVLLEAGLPVVCHWKHESRK